MRLIVPLVHPIEKETCGVATLFTMLCVTPSVGDRGSWQCPLVLRHIVQC
jgi:hypothetical protein